MRKVLIAIVVLIVVVWLIPYDRLPDGQIQVPPPVEPLVLLPDRVALSPMAQKAQSAQFLAPGSAGMEHAFAAERIDPLWATAMEGHILGQLAQANLQLVTMQVECRTSLCRVQLMERPSESADMAAFRDLVRGFGLDVWRMNNLGNQSGATTTVAYLARRESLLPAQQQALIRELERTLPQAQREAAIMVLKLDGDPEASVDSEPKVAPPPP